MISKFRRGFAVFSLVALFSVVAAAPSNAATPTGVGSAGGTTTLLSLDYGDILKAALLGEKSVSSIDPVHGTPSATETLSPLDVNSVTLPALNALTVAPIQTTSTGAPDSKTTALLDLSTLGVPGVAGVVNPATLASLVDAEGAKAALTSTLANLSLLGILGLDSASLDLGGLAGPSSASATRGVTADAITVLDLQALLNMLGLGIGNLSLQQIADLIQQLGQVPAVNSVLGNTSFAGAGDIVTGVTNAKSAVATAQGAVDSAQTTLDAAVASLANVCAGLSGLPLTLCQTTNALLIGTLTTAVSTAQGVVDTAQGVLDTALGLLDSLLNGLVDVLGGTPLVSIDGVQAGAVATATDTVDHSVATVTAAIKDIRIGGLDLGPIDANAALTQVEALAASAMTTLGQVLSTIDPSLANLLSLKLFEQGTSVAQSGDYVQAIAGITAVALTITPPDICAVVSHVLAGTPISSLTSGLTLPATPVTTVLDQLGSIVPNCLPSLTGAAVRAALPAGAVAALTGPLTLKAASVTSAAEFKVGATPALPSTPVVPESPSLPRTGMNETLLLVIGGLMAAFALGLRRVSVPARAQARKQ